MNFSPQDVENAFLELQSAIRAEKNTKKIRKIDQSVFNTIPQLIKFLNTEAEKNAAVDIDRYIQIKDRLRQIERAFKTLFQIRYSKIVRVPVFDNNTDEMINLTEDEREFVDRIYSEVKEQYNQLLGIQPVQVSEKPIVIKGDQKTENEPKRDESPEEFTAVRILGDQPPIAQTDRNYYFRDGEIVFLRKRFAELLVKRKIATEIAIRKNA